MNRTSNSLMTQTIAFAVVVLLTATPTFGQAFGGGGMGMGGGGMGGMGMGMPMTPLEQLKEKLRLAKGDAAQQRVLGKIKTMLSKQYDTYLKQHEAELQQMEKSVKALRAQLERRKSAKVQLLKLELQRISNEASGLVWPDEPDPMAGMGGGMMGGMGGPPGMGGMGGGMMGPGGGLVGPMMVADDSTHGGEDLEEEGDSDPESETLNQLRVITLACLNYESANMHFPANISDEDGKPLLSWRVAILQFLDEPEQALYKKFKLDEPWNSEHNVQLLAELPDVYKNAEFDSQFKTVYLGFDGDGTMFESGESVGFGKIIDGSSNTLLLAQMNQQSAIMWTKPADVKFTPGTPVAQLAETANGNVLMALCDGSTQSIKVEDTDATNLELLIQRNAGKIVDVHNK